MAPDERDEFTPPVLRGADLQAVIDSIVDYAILSLDVDGIVATWNRGAERLKGYTAQEIVGRHFSIFYPPEDQASGLANELLGQALLNGSVEHSGWRVRKDGSRFWGNVVISVIRNKEGEHIGFVKVTRDLTERQAAQEREHALTLDLERANRMKAEFLANMSHEIRTPLNGVIGMLTLLRDTELSERQREFADTASSSSESLLRIVNDILDFSKMDAGKLELEYLDFSLIKVLNDVAALYAPSAKAKGLAFNLEVNKDVPAVIRTDPGRLRQVLTNLLNNAVKFTEAGSVQLNVAVESAIGDMAVLRMSVADTGIGMSELERVRLFRAFTQADVSTTRQYGGTGLGLAISSQLVELLGGSLDVISDEGKGSTFSFAIPVRVSESDDAVDVGTLQVQGGEPAAVGERGGDVLVVEDNLVNQRVTALLVEKLGYRTHVVDNGSLALEALKVSHFDAVLMDCQMPVMDGFEATRRIRDGEGPDNHLPIIAVTAAALPEEKQRCFDAGMDDYVSKPVTQTTLAEALARHIVQAPGAVNPDASLPAEVDATANPAAPIALDRLAGVRTALGAEFANVLRTFLHTSEERLHELREAFADRDAEAIHRLAHTVKGSSSTFGADAMAEAAKRVEAAAADGDVVRAHHAFSYLESTFAQADSFLRAELEVLEQ